jgi:catechol 2,3-dioxygenase-like lactoylglutathione lyase family enzyme
MRKESMPASKPPVLRISNVRLRVRNLDRSVAFYRDLLSVAFYRDLLGLQERPHRILNGKICECVAQDPHCEEFGIAFTQGLWDDGMTGPLEQVSFEVATIEEATSLYAKARELGAQAIRPRVYAGYWQTVIFDPDGHKLEITARDANLSQEVAG